LYFQSIEPSVEGRETTYFNKSQRRNEMAKGQDKGGKDKLQNKDKKKIGIKEKRKLKKEKAEGKQGVLGKE